MANYDYLYDETDAAEDDFESRKPEFNICHQCEGSGEGNWDGSTCPVCGGSGDL